MKARGKWHTANKKNYLNFIKVCDFHLEHFPACLYKKEVEKDDSSMFSGFMQQKLNCITNGTGV
jgi:hypothetical protein